MTTTSVGVKTRDRACASAVAVVAATLLFVAPLHAQLTIAVPANQEWVDTGMDVMQGDQAVFLNRGVRFDYQTQMPTAGRLYLGMNDIPGTYSDNLGNVSVSIRSYPSRMPNLKGQILKDVVGPSERAPAPPTQQLQMPDLRKHSLNDAFGILSKYHRRPRVEQGFSDLPRGLVYDQEPPPGIDLATVHEIVLHVSDGVPPPESTAVPSPQPLRMPDLRNHSLNEAITTLWEYHRKPRVEQGSSQLARGLVYDQEPLPGTDLATVHDVVLHVSDGTKPSLPPPHPTPPPPPLLFWRVVAALAVTTSVLAAAKAVQHLRWKRASNVKAILDLTGASSVSLLTTAAPPVGLQGRLEMGDASPVGPIPVKTEEQRHE